MVLHNKKSTDEKEADFAIFFTALGGMFGNGSIIALGFRSLELAIAVAPLLLWRVIRSGPACDSLFSKTLK